MTQYMLETAKWSVMWVANRRVVEKKFGTNLPEAMVFRDRVVDAGRKGVTLRCCNMGHAPPYSITHKRVEKIVSKKVRKGKYKGKRVKVRVVEYVDQMNDLNKSGLFWCPYCMKMRGFREIKTKKAVLVQCPMCKITSRDWHVRRHNPHALYLSYQRKVRRSRKETNGKRQRRTRKH